MSRENFIFSKNFLIFIIKLQKIIQKLQNSVNLHFILFTKYLNVHYMLANMLSVSFGIINNFFLNYYLNFKIKDNITLRMLSFYGVGIIGLLCSNGLLFLLVQQIGLLQVIAKLVTIFIVTLIQFGLNKTISFKENK